MHACKIINNTVGVLTNEFIASSATIANNSLVNIQTEIASMQYCNVYNSLVGVQLKSGTINYCDIHNHTEYNIVNKADNDVNATYNWWGTTNETLINQGIYDYYDNSTLGRVLYEPYLQAPIESYPVASFIYEPIEPVVNETVTFDASASYDSDGSIVSYFWDFGNGINATESGTITTHAYRNPDIYTVTLTVTDNDGLNDAAAKSVNVGKLSSTISISASPAIITIGENTIISGSITPTRVEVNVTIWNRLSGEETWTILTNVTTNQNSEYSYDWSPSEPGTSELKASWEGDEYTLSAETSIVTVACLKIVTHISISTSCPSTFVGFKVNITGTLRDMYENTLRDETVVLYYTFSGIIEWVPITSDSTDTSGNYQAIWIPPATGYFVLKAEWAGNATHSEVSNTTTLSSLAYQDQYIFFVESNSTISELAFDTKNWKLSFTATGPNGTRGYVKVTVAKSLAANITNIRVYMDGRQSEFSVTSLDDSWLLTFTYIHSTHQIDVDLDINIVPEFPTWTTTLLTLIVLTVVIAIYKRRLFKTPIH